MENYEKQLILKRPVARGNISLYEDVMVFMNIDKHGIEEKYIISQMTEIHIRFHCLNFTYNHEGVSIALGKNRTDWVKLLNDIRSGSIPEKERTENIESFIKKKFSERQLVEAAKYYLRMEGGSRKNAVDQVKKILQI